MSLRVALVQTDIAWHDRAANLARAEAQVRAAVAQGAGLVVFPEMFACGFTMDDFQAEPEGGPTEAWALATAQAHDVCVIVGCPQLGAGGSTPRNAPGDREARASDARPRNIALLARPDGSVARYAKTHLFSFSDENQHYAAGVEVVTWEIGGVRVTPLICYDLRFPEPFRLAADDTHAFVVIASWPERRAMHWRTLLHARAIENQAWVLGVNRVGEGGGLHYRGDTSAIDPWGEVVGAVAHQPGLLVVDIDPEAVEAARAAFPPLRDRRSDLRRR